jgi:predicted unusual protein kinase regulating ubiquinone biosynthesis (AarF/ABC1/UbiB family)
MVRAIDEHGHVVDPLQLEPGAQQQQQQQQAPAATRARPGAGDAAQPGRGGSCGRRGARAPPAPLPPSAQLVLLDFGLAEELSPAVRRHFISFLQHIMAGNGQAAAGHLLRWTAGRQACPDPEALTADVCRLAAQRCDVHSSAGVDLDGVMKEVLRLARKHQVTIDSSYASLVIAVCVIVGFATSLDPRVNLVDAAVPALLMHNLTGRVMGRLYS